MEEPTLGQQKAERGAPGTQIECRLLKVERMSWKREARHNRSPAHECWAFDRKTIRVPLGTAGLVSSCGLKSNSINHKPSTHVLGYDCDALRALLSSD